MSFSRRSSSCDASVLAASSSADAASSEDALMAGVSASEDLAPNDRKPPAREDFLEHTPMLELEDFLEQEVEAEEVFLLQEVEAEEVFREQEDS